MAHASEDGQVSAEMLRGSGCGAGVASSPWHHQCSIEDL